MSRAGGSDEQKSDVYVRRSSCFGMFHSHTSSDNQPAETIRIPLNVLKTANVKGFVSFSKVGFAWEQVTC